MPSNRKKPGKPHPVDVHIGRRLRLRRMLMGLSQTELGQHIGVTFQQLQKYETGTNRVSGSKLYEAAQVLHTTPQFFYDGMNQKAVDIVEDSLTGDRELIELTRAYMAVPDKQARRAFIQLLRCWPQGE